jgi:hypothetical protein
MLITLGEVDITSEQGAPGSMLECEKRIVTAAGFGFVAVRA